MLEMDSVIPETFVDPLTGQEVQLRLLYRTQTYVKDRTVNINGRDMDLIALEEMNDYENMLLLCEANSGKLVDRQFDLNKLNTLEIPF